MSDEFAHVQTLSYGTATLSHLSWSPHGPLLAARVFDGTIKVWNVETGTLLATFDQKPTSVSKLVWSPSGETLASCRGTYVVRVWSISQRSGEWLQGDIGSIESIAWSPDGILLAVAGGRDSRIQLWNVQTKEILETINLPDAILDVAWFATSSRMAIVVKEAVYIRKALGELLRRELPRNFPLNCLKWSPDGKVLASAISYGIRLWHLDDGEIGVLEASGEGVTSISFSSDGALLAGTCLDGTVDVWACDGWKKISTFRESQSRSDQSETIAFSPSMPLLATVGAAGTAIKIWSLNLDALLRKVKHVRTALYTTAKVALVGRSAVGKTVLGWRLVYDEFKEHPSTHGQHFWLFDSLKYVRTDGVHCEVILWDLAGQPDYRITHVLFLDDVDLALILFDSADQKEPLKDVEYWLKQLPSTCRRILVGSKADRGYASVSSEYLAEFCEHHGITGGFVATSALTGENVLDLFGRIKSEIDSIKLQASIASESFNRIKSFVLGLKEEVVHHEDTDNTNRSGVIVSMAELRQRLGASSSPELGDEMWDAVHHLDRHGFVKRITTSSNQQVLLLVPELLNNLAASLILEARRNDRGLGAIDENAVLRGELPFPELTFLGTAESEILLDATVGLLIERNVCFRATIGNTSLLIFPALINQKRPVLRDSEKTTETITFVASGAIENVYPRLVVLLGYTNTFTRTQQWQNQAQYEIKPGAVCGFRLIEENEGEIQLVLYFGKHVEEPERLLFEGLFELFLRRPGLRVRKYPPVRCEKCEEFLPRVLVVEYMNNEQESVFCPKCGNNVSIGAAVTIDLQAGLSRTVQFAASRETQLTRLKTVFETALVRVKRYRLGQGTLNENPTCFISYAWGNNSLERWVTRLADDLKNNQIEVLFDKWHSAAAGSHVGTYLERIETSDFVLIVGTPQYKEKRNDRDKPSMLSKEIDIIYGVMLEKGAGMPKVIPLLLEGEKSEAFPTLLLGVVHIDFREPKLYLASLLDLLLNLHGIPTGEPSFAEYRERLRNVVEITETDRDTKTL